MIIILRKLPSEKGGNEQSQQTNYSNTLLPTLFKSEEIVEGGILITFVALM